MWSPQFSTLNYYFILICLIYHNQFLNPTIAQVSPHCPSQIHLLLPNRRVRFKPFFITLTPFRLLLGPSLNFYDLLFILLCTCISIHLKTNISLPFQTILFLHIYSLILHFAHKNDHVGYKLYAIVIN